MTKAQQILDLYDGVRSTSEIAATVGCDPAYVRVVARQRRGRGESENDIRYRRSPLGRLALKRAQTKWLSKPENRAHKNKLTRDWRAVNPERVKQSQNNWYWLNGGREHVRQYKARKRAERQVESA